ncbi:MAG: DUF4347 domain-containing protein [Cyanobacteria bacterium P01_A01_bin.37]
MEIMNSTQELVFIDAGIHEHEALARGVRPGVQSITINSDENGIERITQTLATASDVQAVHIISHGEPGKLFLGTSILSSETLKASLHLLKSWTSAFARGSELLLYGCNVAAGNRGESFVKTLSSWLDIPVAASTHRVGHQSLDGSWNLDHRTGNIVTNNAIQATTRAAYQGAFALNLLYGSDNQGNIYEVDLTSGASELIGTVPGTFAIARDAETGLIFSIANGANNQQVSTFNPLTRTSAPVGATGVGGTFFKLAQAQDGRLFGTQDNNSNLFLFDSTTGAATDLGVIAGLPSGSGDVAFNPNNPNELLILVTRTSPQNVYDLYSVDISDVNNLSATLFGSIVNEAGNPLTAGGGSGTLAFGQDGNLYVTSRNDGTNASTNDTLFRIPVVNGVVPTGTITAEFVGETENSIGQGVSLTDFATLPVLPPEPPVNADLLVDITNDDGLTTVVPGQQITYVIEVTNTSEVATAIQVQDFVPSVLLNPSFTVSIPATSGFLPDPGDLSGTGNIDAIEAVLNAGESFTIELTGQVDPSAADNTPIVNTATATVVDNITDLNPLGSPVSATDGDTVVNSTTPPPPPPSVVDISVVTNTDQTSRIGPGADTTYTIQVTNNSSGAVQNIRIEDVIPPEILNASFQVTVPSGGGSVNPGDESGTGDVDVLVNLNAGGTATITIQGQVDPNVPDNTLIRNTATATPPAGSQDSNPDDNTLSDRTRVDADIISVPDDCDNGLGGNFEGGNGNDVIDGSAGVDQLTGLDGADLLRGLACPDDIFGGQGNDTLFGNQQRDVINANQGDDVVKGGTGPDQINAGLGNDAVKGGSQNDRIRGRKGNDDLNGNQGNDLVRGDDGNDNVRGGSGLDRVFGGTGSDNVRGGGGVDFVQAGPGSDTASGGAGDDLVVGGLGDDIVLGQNGSDRLRGRRGNDEVRGGFGDDDATGGLGNDEVRGSRGQDTLLGNQGNDKVVAGPGDDIARGGLGADIVKGNKGDDRIFLGRGNDIGRGNSGNDLIQGKLGNDTISGGGGQDEVNGGFGNDRVFGGAGADVVRGNQNDDRINGRQGQDTVRGGLGDDIVRGGGGNDLLFGGRGNDVLRGGNGSDTLVGGVGNDTLFGGVGADIFVYQGIRDQTDTIQDFGTGADRIDVSAILSAPAFSGGNPFSNIRIRNVAGGSSVVQIDANGNQPGRDFQDIAILIGVSPADVPNSVFIV